ncbi:MAG: SMC-Scp complex subunit ScpB [Chloroflexota bacterium]
MPTAPGAAGDGTLGLVARLEGVLFASAGPVRVEQLAAAVGENVREVEKALDVLAEICRQRGIRLQRHAAQVQLTTAPEVAVDVERLLGLETTARLTQAALEVLAIIAYQQPVTRPQIDAVRGVNSDSALRTLLRHGLIDEAGRSEGPGRPILYVTTPEFLQHFGLSSLRELPPLGLPTMQGAEEGQAPQDETE